MDIEVSIRSDRKHAMQTVGVMAPHATFKLIARLEAYKVSKP